MKYVSEIHALNLSCSLNTSGDWHCSAIQWKKPHIHESEGSLWGDYGIEHDRCIPEHEGTYHVANHIRALLDLLELGKFDIAQGMRDDFICTDEYDKEIFDKVYMLKNSEIWDKICTFMGKEYKMKWVRYLEGRK